MRALLEMLPVILASPELRAGQRARGRMEEQLPRLIATLTARLSERQESVQVRARWRSRCRASSMPRALACAPQLDVFQTFSSLLSAWTAVPALDPATDKLAAVGRALAAQLTAKSLPVRAAAASLLLAFSQAVARRAMDDGDAAHAAQLVRVGLEAHLGAWVQTLAKALDVGCAAHTCADLLPSWPSLTTLPLLPPQDERTSPDFSVPLLRALQALLDTGSARAWAPHVHLIVRPLLACARAKYYKVAAEGLRAGARMLGALASTGAAEVRVGETIAVLQWRLS